MRLIEYWGGRMSGDVPDRPKRAGRCSEMLRLFLIP